MAEHWLLVSKGQYLGWAFPLDPVLWKTGDHEPTTHRKVLWRSPCEEPVCVESDQEQPQGRKEEGNRLLLRVSLSCTVVMSEGQALFSGMDFFYL